MRRWAGLAASFVITSAAIVWFVVGGSAAVLDSASMEPFASPGDLLVHRTEPAAAIGVDDVITVRVPGRGLVTHRVVAVEDHDGDRSAVLIGDASRLPDPVPVGLPDEVDRVALVVPRLGAVLRSSGPWLLGGIVLLLAGALVLRLARRHPPPAPAHDAQRATDGVDPRLEALLATCEQLEDEGLPPPVVADILRVRTAAIVGLAPAERSGAVLSLDDGGRFYVLAVADADRGMLRLVPVDSRRRRDGTAALDLWWDVVAADPAPGAVEAIAPSLGPG